MHLLAIAILVIVAMAAAAQAPDQQRVAPLVAPEIVRQTVPPSAGCTDEGLFADLWTRPRLSPCDRSLIMFSAVVPGGSTVQTRGQFNRALYNGVTLSELGETITYFALYFGWSNALLPVADTREVFMGRGIVAAALVASPTVPLAVARYRELADATSVDVNVRPAKHALANYTDRISVADLSPRSQRALRNRSLAVVAAIKVQGVRLPEAVLAFSDSDVPPLG